MQGDLFPDLPVDDMTPLQVAQRVAQEAARNIMVKRRIGYALGGKRSEEHTSELQSLMRISYAVFCLKKKKNNVIEKHIIKIRKRPTHTIIWQNDTTQIKTH